MDRHIHLSLGLPGGGVFLLTIAFVVLKALGYLDWDWIWIFSPLWIPFGLVGVFLWLAGLIWGVVFVWHWLNEIV